MFPSDFKYEQSSNLRSPGPWWIISEEKRFCYRDLEVLFIEKTDDGWSWKLVVELDPSYMGKVMYRLPQNDEGQLFEEGNAATEEEAAKFAKDAFWKYHRTNQTPNTFFLDKEKYQGGRSN